MRKDSGPTLLVFFVVIPSSAPSACEHQFNKLLVWFAKHLQESYMPYLFGVVEGDWYGALDVATVGLA